MNGQERAQEAIAFGLGIDAEGYNIVVSGLSSSGRTTAVRHQVNELASARPLASDWCYFYNFDNAYLPRAAALPAGSGVALQRDLARLIDACSNEIPKAFENETYQERSARALEPMSTKREALLEEMQRSAAAQGYLVNVTPMGFVAVPVGQDGRPLLPEVLSSLPNELRATIEHGGEAVERAVTIAVRELRKLDVQAREAIEALDQEVTRFVVGHHFDELREGYGQYGLADHFDAIERDILQNIDSYKRFTQSVVQQLPAHLVAQATEERAALLRRYGVNVFVSQPTPAAGAPVIEERSPTYFNLFGRIDYQAHFGALTTDFTQIRPGAVHRANGGYLILQAEELLADGRAWLMLKRSLKTHEVRVEGIGDLMMPFPAVNVVPAAIPLSLKVILIGQPPVVAALEYLDPDFAELFKVRAEFEPDSDCDEVTIGSYAAFIRRMTDAHGLLPYSSEAVTEVVYYGNRLAGRQDRVTTRYGALGDLCQEASHVAQLDGASEVGARHVLSAIEGKRRRSSLIPDRLRRLIAEGTLRIETTGAVVGQVNGLAVYQVGSYAFGTPVRISCRTGNGRRGVVAIEREVERSGAIHTKGVLVLSGYLTGTFGRDRVLAFTSSITFEQSYDEVEGDSASSAELYAILSSLASVPLRQDVAVTGSVDQFGRIQPVGGVTEKVEGFFDVCRAVGLTGAQGVMIPATNVVNLTLRPDVVEAVAEGRFHLWSVSTVEEGLELLTGVPAGERTPEGTYPPSTLFRRVTDALEEMRQAAAAASDGRAADG
jgi:predicted ATP-dependent protease